MNTQENQPTKYILTKNINQSDFAHLKRSFSKGEIVYLFEGPTYGCISKNGKAFSETYNENPFFELPIDSVELVIE